MLFLLFVVIGVCCMVLYQKRRQEFVAQQPNTMQIADEKQSNLTGLENILSNTEPQGQKETIDLFAKAAVLMDASNQRVLYGKDENAVLPMASTTKIMTCILALEYGEKVPLAQDYATVSSYAASQPKVKANLRAGEQYAMADLLYSMMLESHNDTAVVVAEQIGRWLLKKDIAKTTEESKAYVRAFADWMDEKARSLGCQNTHFVTPNGLDGMDEEGTHATTAKELGMIAAYALQNEAFRNIIATSAYGFTDKEGQHTVSANNKDAYLTMDAEAIGIKTGFTNQAGYCFVGAKETSAGTLISVVLGCGWPPAKTRKWSDTRKLMEYGTTHFTRQDIVIQESDAYLQVEDGIESFCYAKSEQIKKESLLIGDMDQITMYKYTLGKISAPVKKGDLVGYQILCINEVPWKQIPICAQQDIERWNISYCIEKIANLWLL